MNRLILIFIVIIAISVAGYFQLAPEFVREQQYVENSKRILLSGAGSVYSGHSSGIGHTYRYHIVRDNFGGKYYVMICSGKNKTADSASVLSYMPENTRLVLTVNKSEADDADFGTVERPIPVFKFMKGDNLEVSEDEYLKSVREYLAFGKGMTFCATKADAEKKETRKTILLSALIFIGAPVSFFLVVRKNDKIRTGFLKKIKSRPNDNASAE
jgi:hypothetical protein